MKKIMLALLCAIAFTTTIFAHHDIDGPFDELRVNGKIRVLLEAGEEDAITISNDEDKVSVEVKEGVLIVKRRERWKYSSYKKYIEVVVTYKDKIRRISADAGAEINAEEPLRTGDALSLYFGTGSLADLEVNVEDLEVSCGEGAILELSGAAEELTVKGSTGAQVEAFDLQAERVYARANTGGMVEVNAGERIEANANTGGVIEYRGNPERTNISNELGGQVRSVEGS